MLGNISNGLSPSESSHDRVVSLSFSQSMDSDSNLSAPMNIYDLVIEELGSFEEYPATARNNQDEEADFSDNDIDEGDLVLSCTDASITKYHKNDLKAIAIK